MEYLLMYSQGTDPQPWDPAGQSIGEWVAETIANRTNEYGERLRPAEDTTLVRVRDGKVLLTEGPFTESKEWAGGFDIISCTNLDEAIEIASKHPATRMGTTEVRPFMEGPDADPDSYVVPLGFPGRPTKGKRYLMLVCVDPSGEKGVEDEVDPWVETWDAAGVRLFGEVLRPPADGTFVRTRQGKVLVTDGPYSEAKEWIAGLDYIEVRDFDQAVEVAAGHPMARSGLIALVPAWPFDVDGDHAAREEREASEWGRRTEPAVGATP